MKKILPVSTLFLLLLGMAFAGQVYALDIYPGLELYDGSGTSSSQNDIDNLLKSYFEPDLVELYKNDVGVGGSGSLEGSYDTTFFNTPSDPSGALIEYIGGTIITDAYLLVKDGRNEPYWYLFDLTSGGLGWNGTDDLELSGFWPDQGAISHVTLYGQAASVPEPATMLLLGTGLIGLVGLSRQKMKK